MIKRDKKQPKEEIIEGIILRADYGYGMKFKDPEGLYLKLEIQQFDGYECVQLFREENIGKLLIQFKGEYRGEVSIRHLQHRRVFLLVSEQTNGVADAVAKMPPSQFPQYSWIYNNNWD